VDHVEVCAEELREDDRDVARVVAVRREVRGDDDPPGRATGVAFLHRQHRAGGEANGALGRAPEHDVLQAREPARPDGDHVGDACDNANGNDLDGDGVANAMDNCPLQANTDQADADNDGFGDACDGANGSDLDGDGVTNEQDNCPFLANADQADADNDGFGDACDKKKDGGGGGCSVGGDAGGAWIALLGLALLGRRRKRAL
jgi:MYXO-CTERM domain-containing protein